MSNAGHDEQGLSRPEAPRPGGGASTAAAQSGFEPLRKLYRRYLWLGGGSILAASAFALLATGPFVGFTLALGLACGACFLALGLWGTRVGAAAPVLSSSLNLLQAGKLADASALLDTLERSKVPGVAISRHIQRAMIAVRQGDLDAAVRHSEVVLAAPPRLLFRSVHEVQRATALGIRAWARAARGQLDDAMSDVAAVRAAAVPTPEALAHAALAEALVLERRGDRDGLASVLRRERRLLSASLDVRERAIVRAMQRMLKSPPRSVYRTAAGDRRPEHDDEPTIAEWLDRVAPELTAFAPRRHAAPVSSKTARAPDLVPSNEAVAKARAQAKGTTPLRNNMLVRLIVLWTLLVTMFIVIWRFLLPPGTEFIGPRRPVAPMPPVSPLWGLAVGALLVGMFVRLVRRNQAESTKLHKVAAAIARGEDVDAELAELAGSRLVLTAAQAELLRATVADRRGRLADGIAHIDAGRARITTEGTRAAAAGMLSPALTAARAYMLAALRRPDEAAAELAMIPDDYLFLDRTRFAVKLVSLLANGDIESAGQLVDATSPDLSIGPRDELLRDLVKAVTTQGSTGAAEIARLRDELREDDESRHWIELVAPALLARFHSVTAPDDAGAREALSDAPFAEREGTFEHGSIQSVEEQVAARDTAAEVEAAAEEEAMSGARRERA